MEKIDAYRTEDGKVFTSEIEAKKHETMGKLDNDLMQVVEKIHSYDMTRQELCNDLKNNASEFARILGKIAEIVGN
jgi:hypothetical protein